MESLKYYVATIYSRIFYNAFALAKAYVKQTVKSKIFYNRKVHLRSFVDICTEDVLKGNITSKMIELVADMVDTTAHEIVHLNEGADCKSTHDKRFHKELSKLLGKLFVSKETLEKSSLSLLKKVLPTNL
ncbi:MAG: hypothetical protein H0W50_11285 [Parachlamydiaceae bacterium]|nr:hypothetical protein [Parachlamydiaceae bacterium]